MPYGDRWRMQRKLFTQHLNPNNTKLFHLVVLEFIQNMLRQLRDKPDDFLNITYQYALKHPMSLYTHF